MLNYNFPDFMVVGIKVIIEIIGQNTPKKRTQPCLIEKKATETLQTTRHSI